MRAYAHCRGWAHRRVSTRKHCHKVFWVGLSFPSSCSPHSQKSPWYDLGGGWLDVKNQWSIYLSSALRKLPSSTVLTSVAEGRQKEWKRHCGIFIAVFTFDHVVFVSVWGQLRINNRWGKKRNILSIQVKGCTGFLCVFFVTKNPRGIDR